MTFSFFYLYKITNNEFKRYFNKKNILINFIIIKLFNVINPLSAKFIKWSNTLKQIVGQLPTICLSVFDHFSELAFKGLK